MNLASEALADGRSLRPTPVVVSAEAAVARRHRDEQFSAFYRRHQREVAEALALTLGDTHLAAEAADEAMVRAYQRWSKVGAYDNPAGWVYRVGLNWARSFLRRRQRAPQPFAEGFVEPATATEPSLIEALKALEIDQRSVVVCRHFLGLSEAETAMVLGLRPGTVKSRLHRGLRQLSGRLDHLRPEEPR